MKKREVTSQKKEGWSRGCIAIVMALCAACACLGNENLPPAVDWAVAHGLGYLARQQQPDGSFSGFDDSGPRAEPAAEALLAFLSAGQTPAAGRDALVVRNAIDYLVRQLPDDGEFGRADGSGARGQALITIALAQAYGLDGATSDAGQRKALREALDKSLRVILAMQDARAETAAKGRGGWRAEAHPHSDLATTMWMVLALRSLRDAGWEVAPEPFQRAAAFVRSCATAGGWAEPVAAGKTTAASTAAALATLVLCDAADEAETARGLKLLAARQIETEPAEDYYRGLYAASLAIQLTAAPNADAVTAAWKPVREALLSKQAPDGGWFPLKSPAAGLGTVPVTADAILGLTLGYRLLPVYDR